ncbi:hypothetical protein AABD35_13015 [Staphylococcus xylosus]|uniref:hypothetical protein n=1 Tax=Staphylococcus xylosus TaxID=1288 RepID=UPI00398B8895
MIKYTQNQTRERYREFEELFLYPKQSTIADMSGVNRTALASFLSGRAYMSDMGLIKLNHFIDTQMNKIKDELVTH